MLAFLSMRERTAFLGQLAEDRNLRAFSRKAGVVVLLLVSLALLWAIRDVLLVIYISAVVSAGIAPMVRRVQIWGRLYLKRRLRRGTAVLLVYLPFLAAAIVFVILALPRILLEFRALSGELPRLFDEYIARPLEPWVPIRELDDLLLQINGGQLEIFGYVKSAVTAVIGLVSILFMVVYMLIDAERLRNHVLIFFPADERARKRKTIRRISRRMSSWLTAQIILALAVGLATLAGLLLLGIPYAVPLALIAMVGELVPVIGPIVGAVPVLAVAIMQSPSQFWGALALAVLIQILENYLLVPRIMGRQVSISPLAVFVAFLVGASLFGIVGALIAVPTAAIIQVVFEETFIVPRERRQSAERPGSLLVRDRQAG